jgi:hypothetical protein
VRRGQPNLCIYCEKPRCGGKCRLPICKECGRKHYGDCEGETAQLVRAAYARERPPRPELNPSLEQVLRWVSAFIAQYGYSPTIKEIMAGCKYKSPNSVQLHLFGLETRGYITRSHESGEERRKVRSIRLTEQGEAYCERA